MKTPKLTEAQKAIILAGGTNSELLKQVRDQLEAADAQAGRDALEIHRLTQALERANGRAERFKTLARYWRAKSIQE